MAGYFTLILPTSSGGRPWCVTFRIGLSYLLMTVLFIDDTDLLHIKMEEERVHKVHEALQESITKWGSLLRRCPEAREVLHQGARLELSAPAVGLRALPGHPHPFLAQDAPSLLPLRLK